MSFQHKVFLLKLALAIVCIGGSIIKLIEPTLWIDQIPDWFLSITTLNRDHALFVLSTVELFIGIWLLIPWKTHITLSVGSVYFLITLFFSMGIVERFNHISHLLLSLGLLLMVWPKKISLTYLDH